MAPHELQELLREFFYIGLMTGALTWYVVGGLFRLVGESFEYQAARERRFSNAKRRAAQATERRDGAGAARSAPDGNHGENLKNPTESSHGN